MSNPAASEDCHVGIRTSCVIAAPPAERLLATARTNSDLDADHADLVRVTAVDYQTARNINSASRPACTWTC